MALTPQELATNSRCFDCIPKGYQGAVLIYLLAQLAEMTDVQTLVTNARCYDCIPKGYQPAVITYLQDAILAGGGGGGATEVYSMNGSTTPDDNLILPAGAAVAYNEVGVVWVWNVPTSEWFLIIS